MSLVLSGKKGYNESESGYSHEYWVERSKKLDAVGSAIYALLHEWIKGRVGNIGDLSSFNLMDGNKKVGHYFFKDLDDETTKAVIPLLKEYAEIYACGVDSNNLHFSFTSAVLLPISLYKKVGQVVVNEINSSITFSLCEDSVNIPGWVVYSLYKNRIVKGFKIKSADFSSLKNLIDFAGNNRVFVIDNDDVNVLVPDSLAFYTPNVYLSELRDCSANLLADRLAEYFLKKAGGYVERVVFAQSLSSEIFLGSSLGDFLCVVLNNGEIVVLPEASWVDQ